MGTSKAVTREIKSTEYPLLREFLYQAIYLPEGMTPLPRSVVDCPELRVYIENFGTRPGDCCLVTEEEGRVVGAVWSRIMDDYGHIDGATPSLAISLLPEYRGQGMGTELIPCFPCFKRRALHRFPFRYRQEIPHFGCMNGWGSKSWPKRKPSILWFGLFPA